MKQNELFYRQIELSVWHHERRARGDVAARTPSRFAVAFAFAFLFLLAPYILVYPSLSYFRVTGKPESTLEMMLGAALLLPMHYSR